MRCNPNEIIISIRKKMRLYILLVISLIIFAVCWNVFSFGSILQGIYKDRELQFNIISTCSIFAGFQFTGVSILISLLERDGVKRLWDQGYLDSMVSAVFHGITLHVLAICIALCSVLKLLQKASIISFVTGLELCVLFVGICCFLFSVYELGFALKKFKSNK